MIEYKGFENLIADVYRSGNQHIFSCWDKLNDDEKFQFINELVTVDLNFFEDSFKSAIKKNEKNYKNPHYIKLQDIENESNEFDYAKEVGEQFIRQGKIAALLVAGGQGTRLNFNGPKGMYPIDNVQDRTFFHIYGEKILAVSKKYDISIPWLVMTSKENHVQTVSFFKKNNFFGLNKKDIYFFEQGMLPTYTLDGKLLLQTKNSLCLNPDGHGGCITALNKSGLLDELDKRGVELISFFQVDNPLVEIIDPLFVGTHILNNSEISSKAVKKVSACEKVGVFVEWDDGTSGIVEYSDLSKKKSEKRNKNGELTFSLGNIAIHLFDLKFLKKIVKNESCMLPYHVAKKNTTTYNSKNIDVYKFEKFIFDLLSMTKKTTILEVSREKEFVPIKNLYGADSVESFRDIFCSR